MSEHHVDQGESDRNSADDSSSEGGCKNYCKSGDLFELIGVLIFGAIAAIPTLFAEPRMRPIPFQLIDSGEYILNQSNDLPFPGDIIPTILSGAVTVALPLLVQLLLSYFLPWARRGELHRTFCTYGIGIAVTALTTESIKRYVGYLRPAFFALCEPNEDMTECTAERSSDARLSFPSGHASLGFCGLYLFTMYLEERVIGLSTVTEVVALSTPSTADLDEENRKNGPTTITMMVKYNTKRPQLYRLYSLLCLVPVAFATFVAVSRIVDNKHFPVDVVAGAVLGVACARFAHRLWFPSAVGLLTMSS